MGLNLGNILKDAGNAAQNQFNRDMIQTGRGVATDVSQAAGAAMREAIGLPPDPRYRGGGYGYGGGYGTPNRGEPIYDVRPRDGGIPFSAYASHQQQINQRQQQPDEIKAAQRQYEAKLAATQEAYYKKLAEMSGGQPAVATPAAAPAQAPAVTAAPATPQAPVSAAPAAASAKPVELAVQQQQAYLKVLGFETGALDGVKGAKTEGALTVFAAKMGISPNDTAAINKALVEQIEHSSKAKAFMDGIRANPNASVEDKKAAQWILKEQQDSPMVKSERNGKMDGQFGAETKGLLAKPYDYAIVEKRAEAGTPTAPVLTKAAGLDASQYTAMRGGGEGVASLSAQPAVAPAVASDAGVQHKEEYKRAQAQLAQTAPAKMGM